MALSIGEISGTALGGAETVSDTEATGADESVVLFEFWGRGGEFSLLVAPGIGVDESGAVG